MTENKAVGKITLLIHTRGRKNTTISSLHLNAKFDFIIQYLFIEKLLYARHGGYK